MRTKRRGLARSAHRWMTIPAWSALLLGAGVAAQDPDTTPPSGRITSPTQGVCLGPSALPVVIEDDFVDERDPELTRAYSPTAVRQRRIDTPTVFPDSFGYSIALDGDLMVVGAPSFNDHLGVGLVYRRSGDEWPLETFFYRGNWPPSRFLGWDVAAAGERVVISAPFTQVGTASWSGRTYIFERSGSTWVETLDMHGDGPESSQEFGNSVDLWDEWTVIGAFREDSFGIHDAGAVYVLRNGFPGTWQKFVAPGPSYHFGISVSMDDEWLAVGSNLDSNVAPWAGSVRLYRLERDTWVEEAYLTPPVERERARFGGSVALSGDVLVVAAGGDRTLGRDAGAAYVFERREGVWTEVAKLLEPGGEPGRRFGRRVAVHGDTIAVSSIVDDVRGEESGSVYLYRRFADGWRPTRKLFADDGAMNDRFGTGLALEGPIVAVGAPGKHLSFFMVKGKLYLFEPTGGPRYRAHGDHLVTLVVEDDAGNRAADSVEFVIDVLSPELTVSEPAEQEVLDDRPFDVVFQAHDHDVASGDVVQEVVYVQGCPAFDGLRYGDGDGALQDEVLRLDFAERCRIADECGFDVLDEVELRFEVRDCAGNVKAETRVHPGGPFRLRTEGCEG